MSHNIQPHPTDSSQFPRVHMESPGALFAPDHLIQTPIPGPLYLLSCIRLPLETAYAMTEDGVVANPAHAFQRNVVTYPDGTRFSAEVSGSPALGLPSVYDLDYLLGLGSLVDQGAVTRDGTLIDVTYRGILQASRPGAETRVTGGKVAAVKRALGRWANTTVRTNMEMVYEGEADSVRAGEQTPRLPNSRPRRREREVTHWILEYDVESEERAGDSSDVIQLLRINPIWIAQTESGIAAWIDLEIHNALRSAVAKSIYLQLVLAVAQGWRPQRHTELLTQWMEALGAQSNERPSEIANRFRSALDELAQHGVVDQNEVTSIRRGVYQVDLMPGHVICDAAAVRGVGSLDPIRTRVLISHLGQHQIPAGEARALLARHGLRVQEVLQRVHYVRTEKRGLDAKGNPIVAWHSWIGAALEQGWEFREPEYEAWVAQRGTRYRSSPIRSDDSKIAAPETQVLLPSPPESAAPTEPRFDLPDDVWGQALAKIRPDVAPMTFTTWFRDTWLQAVQEDAVIVTTPNSFGRDWIMDKFGARLSIALSDLLGHEVQLEVRVGETRAKPIGP